MSYSSGMLNQRVQVVRAMRKATRMGDTTSYVPGAILWASVTWTKGVRALQQGAVEAYDSIMVRLRYTDRIHRQDRLRYDRRFWAIESFNADKSENTIQITATEVGEFPIDNGYGTDSDC